MARFSISASNEQSIYAALELSKNSWLLAIQAPGRDNPSLHPIKGGNSAGLLAKLDAARDRVAKVTGQTPTVTLCFEAGYDGFWLARLLEQRGITCLVMEPASLQVNRRARRVKTDRIDVESILHTLIAWCRGERHVCSMVEGTCHKLGYFTNCAQCNLPLGSGTGGNAPFRESLITTLPMFSG